MTEFTPEEILLSLDLADKSPARVVVELSRRELDAAANRAIFDKFDGAAAYTVSDLLIGPVVSYLLYDAARKLPLNIPDAIARAEKMVYVDFKGNFSEAAARERAALANADKEKAKPKPAPVVDEAGNEVEAAKRGRGRPAKGEKSAYLMALDLFNAAADKSKEAIIGLLQEKLSIGHGSAQTYYYRAKKETAA